MNRVIIIGNGFDLAHGLETGYEHFIADFWRQFSDKIYDRSSIKYDYLRPYEEDPLVALSAKRVNCCKGKTYPVSSSHELKVRLEDYRESYRRYDGTSGGINLTFKSKFFEAINNKLTTQKWVDIENEYYRLVKDIHRRQSVQEITQAQSDELRKELEQLNKDLSAVKGKLADYLKKESRIAVANKDTKRIIDEAVNPRDVAVGGLKALVDHLSDMESDVALPQEIEEDVQNGNYDSPEDMIRHQFDSGERTVQCFRTLLLNFNYTKTANLYLRGASRDLEINHIHGKLDNDKNPIIFGYGDELDESYAKIAEQNDNEYLQNIKSIRYLETDNYRRLLTFIDSAPYQIYVMGHSCGNSDRTLLNTLFEHANCVSIKPFYHLRPDGTDDYMDIVQNISRNFRSPALMRDRVVNQTYCEPLPQKVKNV